MAWIFQVQEKKFEKNCALRLLGANWEKFQALFSIQYFDLVLILKNHTTNQRRKVKSNSKLSYVKRNILVTGCMRKSQPNCEKDSNGRFNRTTQLLESGFICLFSGYHSLKLQMSLFLPFLDDLRKESYSYPKQSAKQKVTLRTLILFRKTAKNYVHTFFAWSKIWCFWINCQIHLKTNPPSRIEENA